MEAVFKTNLRCESCLKTIGPLLDEEPSVGGWEADLADSRKLLKVELGSESDASKVESIMSQAGYEATVIEGSTPQQAQHTQESEPVTFSTYKPLILVLAYVLGATALVETIHTDFVWHRAMTYFMGFFFLGFAFFKLLDVSAFADAFSTYDILAKRSRYYALAYPFIELGLGLLFVSHLVPVVAIVLTVFVMGIGLVGVISAVSKQQAIQCACLGTVFNLPMSVVTIIENSSMIVMAVIMLMRHFAK